MDNRKQLGAFGEKLACDFLKRRGYRIVETNKKLSYLELDIIAKKEGLYIFIEVKTRVETSLGSAVDALKHSQIKKLKKAMCAYSVENRINLAKIRLDFIAIDIKKTEKTANIKHFKDIF
jgi:putative endonuclease